MKLGPASVVWTGRDDGDLGHAGRYVEVDELDPDVVARRRQVLDRPWTWLRQVHGSDVVVVRGPGDRAGSVADAAVTADGGAALAIFTADCGHVAFASPEGVIGAAHAGWRGVVAGVIERTVETMRELGAGSVEVAIGPCISAECYVFGPHELDLVAGDLGDSVRSATASGRPALDLRAAIRASAARAGASVVAVAPECTSCCADRYFSHRARGEVARQAMVVWLG